MSGDWNSHVLRFWFGLNDDEWWNASEALDQRIREEFLDLWEEKRQLPVEAFTTDPLTALAAVIIFDQLPRNMFRGSADQFATDHIALQVAKEAVARGFDQQLPSRERGFFYMPFEHSEKMADQERGLVLFTALGDARMLHFAKLHHDIIARFGRFPHRNAILGRSARPDELAAGKVVPW